MKDRRNFPANDRVACASLRGEIVHVNFVAPTQARVHVPLVDLCQSPAGPRDRQLVFGAILAVYDTHQGWAFVKSQFDGYVGYVPQSSLTTHMDTRQTHFVHAPSTHVYKDPNFKSPDISWLPMTAQIAVLAIRGQFAQTELGWIPLQHLSAIDHPIQDPLDAAIKLIGAPYLWGGNSVRGVDCSGLVQLSLTACAITAPADSDQQTILGQAVTDGTFQRGDLLFWRGHVAWVLDPSTVLHANAFHMCVSTEPLPQAIHRIHSAGDGPVTAHRRISLKT